MLDAAHRVVREREQAVDPEVNARDEQDRPRPVQPHQRVIKITQRRARGADDADLVLSGLVRRLGFRHARGVSLDGRVRCARWYGVFGVHRFDLDFEGGRCRTPSWRLTRRSTTFQSGVSQTSDSRAT